MALDRLDVRRAWRPAAPATGGGSAGTIRRRCAGRRPASDDGCRRRGRRPNSRSGSCRDRPRPRRSRPSASSKVGAGQRLGVRIGLADGDMGIGARLALERDFQLVAAGHGALVSSRSAVCASICAGGFEVAGGVDTERHAVDDGDVDPHAGLQRAQLLELLALLQRRRRQRDEALQRGAAIGVEADMMVERAVAIGRRGAGEIERAQPARGRSASRPPSPRSGLVRSSSVWISAASVAMSTAGSSSGGSAARMSSGAMVGRSPCRLTTISARPSGSSVPQRLEDAVGAGGMIGARHHRLAAGGLHGGRDLGRVGGDRHPADSGLLGPPQHVDDHRQAGDVDQRLAGQAGRGHAGGNQHQSAGFGHRTRSADRRKQAGNNGDGSESRRVYTGCQSTGKPISQPARGAARKPDS